MTSSRLYCLKNAFDVSVASKDYTILFTAKRQMVLLRSADSGLNERRVIAVIMSVTVFISIKSSAFLVVWEIA